MVSPTELSGVYPLLVEIDRPPDRLAGLIEDGGGGEEWRESEALSEIGGVERELKASNETRKSRMRLGRARVEEMERDERRSLCGS